MTAMRDTRMWTVLTAMFVSAALALAVVNWSIKPDVAAVRANSEQVLCIADYKTAHDVAQDQVILAYFHDDDTALQLAASQLAAAAEDLAQLKDLCG